MTSIESARNFWVSLHSAPLPLPDELRYRIGVMARGPHPTTACVDVRVRWVIFDDAAFYDGSVPSQIDALIRPYGDALLFPIRGTTRLCTGCISDGHDPRCLYCDALRTGVFSLPVESEPDGGVSDLDIPSDDDL
jgi:hypothetical protein